MSLLRWAVLAGVLLPGASALAGERAPGVVVVVVPRGAVLPAAAGVFARGVARVVGARTALALRDADEVGVDAGAIARCEARVLLSCTLSHVAPVRDARYLFVLSLLPLGGERGRASLIALDLDEARALDSTGTRLENALYGLAASAPPKELARLDVESVSAHAAHALDGPVGALLAKRGDHLPLGAILLEGAPAGLPLRVDGQPAGATEPEITHLGDLRPGTRALQIGAEPAPRDVEIFPGRTATVAFALAPAPAAADHRASRAVLLWGGAATAVAGGVLAGIAAARASDGLRAGCLTRDAAATCDGLGTPTFGYDPSAAPSVDPGRVNPPGVGVAPLGVALLAAGATWAGAALVRRDAEDAPWLETLAGLALGGAAFAIATAAGN